MTPQMFTYMVIFFWGFSLHFYHCDDYYILCKQKAI